MKDKKLKTLHILENLNFRIIWSTRKENNMTEESTPNQESAPEKAPNLDAVLEGAINQALPT